MAKNFPEPQMLAAERREKIRETLREHLRRECGDPNPRSDMPKVVLLELIRLVRSDRMRLIESDRRRPVSIVDAIAFLRGASDKIIIQYERKKPPLCPSLSESVTDFIGAITEAGYEIVRGPFAPGETVRGLRLISE